ncbi:MAG: hypothetical protein QOE58_1246 [Actinomycetota bacterium]|jgi:hypothetical protein|nr:hypothetical protein [Actinomycetota bacterium]
MALVVSGALLATTSACTHSDRRAATPQVTPTSTPSASETSRLAAPFQGHLIKRQSGTGNRELGVVRLTADAELYLQCLNATGNALVDYALHGSSSCPSDGKPIVAQVSAPAYPATVHFQVRADQATRWIVALDSHALTIEGPEATTDG